MHTRVLVVDAQHPEQQIIAEAARVIGKGGLVAFPTETVYGLGAGAFTGAAVRSVFAAKGRPADNPLIVHLADADSVAHVSPAPPPTLPALARRFWPGPLTLVIPASSRLPDAVTASRDTVAVRIPAHPVALALIRAAGPLAAPSANRSGRPSPTQAQHVLHDLGGRIDVVLDGGPTGLGVESTVLDLTTNPPTVLRPGGVPVEQLRAVLGSVVVQSPTGGPRERKGPGSKYGHYAPRTPCLLLEGPEHTMPGFVAATIDDHRRRGRKVGVMVTRQTAAHVEADALCIAGDRDDAKEVARNLYRCLRQLDAQRLDIILLEGIAPAGVGAAVVHRMRQAANYRVLRAPKR